MQKVFAGEKVGGELLEGCEQRIFLLCKASSEAVTMALTMRTEVPVRTCFGPLARHQALPGHQDFMCAPFLSVSLRPERFANLGEATTTRAKQQAAFNPET